MLSKRYESTKVDRRSWLHVPYGTHWSTSSDTHQVVEIQIETCICSTCWDQSFSELVVILSDYDLRISLGTISILRCIHRF